MIGISDRSSSRICLQITLTSLPALIERAAVGLDDILPRLLDTLLNLEPKFHLPQFEKVCSVFPACFVKFEHLINLPSGLGFKMRDISLKT